MEAEGYAAQGSMTLSMYKESFGKAEDILEFTY